MSQAPRTDENRAVELAVRPPQARRPPGSRPRSIPNERRRFEQNPWGRAPVDAPSELDRTTRARAARMREIAELCHDREAASILRAGAAALLRGAAPPWAEKPSWGESEAAEARRPAVLEGRLERRVRGGDAGRRAHVLFRPDDSATQPFPVPEDVVEGLPQGAKLTLGIERGALGEKTYRVLGSEAEYVRSMVADVIVEGGATFAVRRGHLSAYDRVPLSGALAGQLAGNAIVAEILNPGTPKRVAKAAEFLGRSEGPRATFLQAATEAGADLEFPSDVKREIARIKKNPGIKGKDLTDLPFVTIDNDDSKDLDQAVCIRRHKDGGYTVHYAIADASHFVKRGGAIDREARRRSLTTYLPDRSLPMLPPELSEDLCSLVAGKKRRAILVTTKLDARGAVLARTFQRGIIRSRAKLSFDQVQRFHDDQRSEVALRRTEFTETLELLATVGKLRLAMAKARNVVSSADTEPRIHPHELAPSGFVMTQRLRNEVERWNEQVSVMINEEVGKHLAQSGARALYRIHPPPDREAEEAFRTKVGAVGVPWKEGVELREYMESLDPNDPRTKAIRYFAARINRKAKYGTEPLGHAALKLGPYVHFTAPMRRYADIRGVHDVLVALIERKRPPRLDEKEVSEIAGRNEAAERRNQAVLARCHSYMLADVLRDSMLQPIPGTIIDVSPSGVLVELEHPSVVIPMSTQAMRSMGGGHFEADPNGVELRSRKMTLRCGDVLPVTVVWSDPNGGIVDAVPSELLAPQRVRRRPVVADEGAAAALCE